MTDDTRAQALANLQRLGQEYDAAGWWLDADGDICAADGRLVACPCYDEDVWPIEEARRNARRLASVDDLEEALAGIEQTAREYVRNWPNSPTVRAPWEAVLAALAKARGEQG